MISSSVRPPTLPATVVGRDAATQRSVLMVAFQFPPFAESTGAQRVLSFVRHLPSHGWTPTVLTANESTYLERDAASLKRVPAATRVERAFGWDTARDLSIAGRYPRWLALPDRWVTWAVAACWKGLSIVRQRRPDVLWATFPIPSALVASIALRRITGIPLVVDLRDPIVYEHWPTDPALRKSYAWIEREVLKFAHTIVVTTPGARRMYLERYPAISPGRVTVIANGVDDEALEAAKPESHARGTAPVRLLHSGLMEIPDRDPSAMLAAVSGLRERGAIRSGDLQITLRATGQDALYCRKVSELTLDEFVQVAPRLPRHEAIAEMDEADGLLIFQGKACNRQIPAKSYEYLARQRPILGFCDPNGDTYDLLSRQWGVPYMADMEDPADIATAIERFVAAVRSGSTFTPPATLIERNSRRASARELAHILDNANLR